MHTLGMTSHHIVMRARSVRLSIEKTGERKKMEKVPWDVGRGCGCRKGWLAV